MNLYKEYKENIEKQQKENEDKERLGLSAQTVIIYEEGKGFKRIRYIGKVILFVLLFVLIGVVITFIIYFFLSINLKQNAFQTIN